MNNKLKSNNLEIEKIYLFKNKHSINEIKILNKSQFCIKYLMVNSNFKEWVDYNNFDYQYEFIEELMEKKQMINDQITDSVTQIIKYKEGMGKGSISKIIIKYYEDSKYDDIINKFNNPNDLHIPTVEEFKVLHNYLSRTIPPNNYITSESLDDAHVTLCVFQKMIYIQANKSDTYSVILAQIEYNT